MQQEDEAQNRRRAIVPAAVGLLIGLGLGLLIGWLIGSAARSDPSLAGLGAEDKEEYIFLVAAAYGQDQDLERAQARLARLEAPNVTQWISDLADRSLAEGRGEAELRALAGLAHGLGVDNPQLLAYVATVTPLPTDTPRPSPTPLPTQTPSPTVPPTPTPVPPTDTPPPTVTDTPLPTDTPQPPTDTPAPTSPPATARPANTRVPPTPTNTPKPAAPKWTWNAWLVGPGQDGQGCTYGNLQIRVTVQNAGGGQMGGIWVYDRYSGQYQVTGNVDSPDWGPGETKFEYGIGGGGSLCIASGQGGTCVSGSTRDLSCYNMPSVEDLHAAGYCSQCCENGATVERCRELVQAGKCMGNGHYSWRVVFQRSP